MLEVIRTLVPVGSVILGAWLGSRFTLRNSLKAIEVENEQRVKEWERDKKIKVQEELKYWLEDYAITGCVDPLLSEILLIESIVIRAHLTGKVVFDVTMPDLPHSSCVRIFTLTGSARFTLLVQTLRSRRGDTTKENCHRIMETLNTISLLLIGLRQLLTSVDIESKSDLYKLCNDERFQKIGEALDAAATKTLTGSDTAEIAGMTRILRDISPKV